MQFMQLTLVFTFTHLLLCIFSFSILSYYLTDPLYFLIQLIALIVQAKREKRHKGNFTTILLLCVICVGHDF